MYANEVGYTYISHFLIQPLKGHMAEAYPSIQGKHLNLNQAILFHKNGWHMHKHFA